MPWEVLLSKIARDCMLRRVMSQRLRPQVILLGLVSLLNDSASEMIYPLLPVFLTTTLGATPLIVGMIEGSADALASVLKLVAGSLSDRMPRRKPLIVCGYALAAVSRGWIALASGWPSVLGARLLGRTGKGIRSAPRDAMIADVTPEASRGKAFGFHRALDHTGAVVGPVLALLFLDAMHLPLGTTFWIAGGRGGVPAALPAQKKSGGAGGRRQASRRDAGAPILDRAIGDFLVRARQQQRRLSHPAGTRGGRLDGAPSRAVGRAPRHQSALLDRGRPALRPGGAAHAPRRRLALVRRHLLHLSVRAHDRVLLRALRRLRDSVHAQRRGRARVDQRPRAGRDPRQIVRDLLPRQRALRPRRDRAVRRAVRARLGARGVLHRRGAGHRRGDRCRRQCAIASAVRHVAPLHDCSAWSCRASRSIRARSALG